MNSARVMGTPRRPDHRTHDHGLLVTKQYPRTAGRGGIEASSPLGRSLATQYHHALGLRLVTTPLFAVICAVVGHLLWQDAQRFIACAVPGMAFVGVFNGYR